MHFTMALHLSDCTAEVGYPSVIVLDELFIIPSVGGWEERNRPGLVYPVECIKDC